MLISSAWAHGSVADSGATNLGPFILLGVGIVFVLVLFAEKKWRRHKQSRENRDGAPPI